MELRARGLFPPKERKPFSLVFPSVIILLVLWADLFIQRDGPSFSSGFGTLCGANVHATRRSLAPNG